MTIKDINAIKVVLRIFDIGVQTLNIYKKVSETNPYIKSNSCTVIEYKEIKRKH